MHHWIFNFFKVAGICLIAIAIEYALIRNHQIDNESDTQMHSQSFTERKLQNITQNGTPIRCRQSIYKIWNKCCLNNLFSEHLDDIGFHHLHQTAPKSQIVPNIQLIRISDVQNATNPLCYGLQIESNAASMIKSQRHPNIRIHLNSIYQKHSLHSTINAYASLNDIVIDFLPQTFSLDNVRERREFFAALPCEDNNKNLWLFKTEQHGGAGIHFIDNPLAMRQLFWRETDIRHAMEFVSPQRFNCNNQNIPRLTASDVVSVYGFDAIHSATNTVYAQRDGVIAQQFIANPLLINNRKFHIRVFVMIASLNPFVVLYGNGFLILSATKYNKNEISKENAITNRAVSRAEHSDIEWTQSFEEFEAYLVNAQIPNIRMADIQQQIKNIVNVTFLSAVKSKKNAKRKSDRFLNAHSHSFQYALFAMDLLLTENGKLYLLEVQKAPKTSFIPKDCRIFNSSENWQCSFGQALANETVDIAVDMALKKMRRIEITKEMMTASISHYELIIFEDFKDFNVRSSKYSTDSNEYYQEFKSDEF